jgi:hypothetical protein
MEPNNQQDNPTGTPLCGKAWTAYIGPLLAAVVLVFLLRLAFNYSEAAAAGVLAVGTLLIGYRVLMLRSVQLYYDDVGVWLYSGILPWSKGVRGVKWRDMDEAVYIQSFGSWLLRGREAVAVINQHHQRLIGEDGLA